MGDYSSSIHKQIIAWFVRDIWRKHHSWYFLSLKAREITYNNFEISLAVFMPNIITNHAVAYTNTVYVDIVLNANEDCIVVFVFD